jgi:hypothetical protein
MLFGTTSSSDGGGPYPLPFCKPSYEPYRCFGIVAHPSPQKDPLHFVGSLTLSSVCAFSRLGEYSTITFCELSYCTRQMLQNSAVSF